MKNFLRIFSMTLAIFALTLGSCQAKAELIEASGSYAIDLKMDETFASATALAREEAKRAATEKAGVYVESYSKTINLELDYDEVKTVAAQLLKIQDEKITSKSLDNGLLEITVTIKALVEEQNDEILKTMMSDKQRIEDATDRYNKLQAEYDALKKQMDEYKRQYATGNSSKKRAIKESVAQTNQYFEALRALESGNNFYFNTNYNSAISEYTRAIEIKSNFAEAYNNRGNSYFQLQNYQQAAQDYQTALSLNRVDARIYNNLGSAYYVMKNYSDAVREYTNAINLNPNLEMAYLNRAYAYYDLGQFQNALADAQKVLSMNPANTDAQRLYNYLMKTSR